MRRRVFAWSAGLILVMNGALLTVMSGTFAFAIIWLYVWTGSQKGMVSYFFGVPWRFYLASAALGILLLWRRLPGWGLIVACLQLIVGVWYFS
jgi:hypothetical protein